MKFHLLLFIAVISTAVLSCSEDPYDILGLNQARAEISKRCRALKAKTHPEAKTATGNAYEHIRVSKACDELLHTTNSSPTNKKDEESNEIYKILSDLKTTIQHLKGETLRPSSQEQSAHDASKCPGFFLDTARITNGIYKTVKHYDDKGELISIESVQVEPGQSRELQDLYTSNSEISKKFDEREEALYTYCKQPLKPSECTKERNRLRDQLYEERNAHHKRFNAQLQEINEKIYVIAAEIAKKRGVNAIFNKGHGNDILYIHPECDITDEVIETINREYLERKRKTGTENELFNLGAMLHDQLGKDGKYIVEMITEDDFSRIVISEKKHNS